MSFVLSETKHYRDSLYERILKSTLFEHGDVMLFIVWIAGELYDCQQCSSVLFQRSESVSGSSLANPSLISRDFLLLCSLPDSVQQMVGFQEVPRTAFVAQLCSLNFFSCAAFYSTIS